MPAALLSLQWISAVILLITLLFGFGMWEVENPLRMHIVAALTGTIFGLFAHTMTMFYFIGTGKKIKDFVKEWESSIQTDLRNRIIHVKRKLFPWMTLVCIMIMATFIAGGAYDAGLVSRPVHEWLAYVTFVLHVHVITKETFHVFRNIELIREVSDMARRRADVATSTGAPG